MKAHTMTKRKQVDKAQALILGVVIGAAVVTVFCLVVSKSLISQAGYLSRVAGVKQKAVDQLKSNKVAVAKLDASYKSFASQTPNLIGGKSTGNGDRDGDNGRLILDALPSQYDFPALATSLEKLLAGYTINSISGSDDAVSQEQVSNSELVDIPFKLDVSTNYAGIQTLTKTFEKSIRPFQIQTLEITGTNGKLEASIGAKTFYQPEKDLKISTKVVK
jgi:Tfp pilus assembly protein PilO